MGAIMNMRLSGKEAMKTTQHGNPKKILLPAKTKFDHSRKVRTFFAISKKY